MENRGTKLQADQYDRQFRVCREVMAFVDLVVTNAGPEVKDLHHLAASTADADFLFPRVVDSQGLTDYIFETFGRYPSLRKLLKVNEEPLPDTSRKPGKFRRESTLYESVRSPAPTCLG